MTTLLLLAFACSGEETGTDSATSTTDSTTDSATSGSLDSGGTATEFALADCDVPLSGVDYGSPLPIEVNPNFDAELAAIDIDALPETLDVSGLVSIYKGVLTYALGQHPDDVTTVSREELRQTAMGTAVLGALALGQDSALGLDFDFLRQGLYRYYTCSKAFPLTLDGFNATIYDTSTITTAEVDSAAKCGPRTIGGDDTAGVYIAETLIDGEVRETEILLTKSRDDGQLDFAVYDAAGQLTDRSQFPTLEGGEHVVVAAPYACMSCHFKQGNSTTGLVYDVLIPTFGPCG